MNREQMIEAVARAFYLDASGLDPEQDAEWIRRPSESDYQLARVAVDAILAMPENQTLCRPEKDA